MQVRGVAMLMGGLPCEIEGWRCLDTKVGDRQGAAARVQER